MRIDAIRNCSSCSIRDLVAQSRSDLILTANHTFTFYYETTHVDKAKFLFIMQNPAIPPDWPKSNDFKILPTFVTDQEFIRYNRNSLFDWLNGKNKPFLEPFLQRLKANKLISYDSSDSELRKRLLEDFLFTDLVKCRAKTSQINADKDKCYTTYLKSEIEEFGRSKLIFIISSRSWHTIFTSMILKQVSKGVSTDKTNLANVHGKLFRCDELDSYIIPLVHFSQTQFYNYLRNSYFDYLNEGLQDFIKHNPNF